jgi:hypothetical protein
MSPRAADTRRGDNPGGVTARLTRAAVLGVTLLFVLAALAVSSALVVYTAWLHHLREGVFALLFAILSSQIALNWLLWRDDEE